MEKRLGAKAWSAYESKLAKTAQARDAYLEQVDQGKTQAIYHFGQGMIDESDIQISPDKLVLPVENGTVPLGDDEGFGGFFGDD